MIRRSVAAPLSALALAVAGCLAGCATPPRATDAKAESTLRALPERLIVVTIANPVSAVSTRAGSTLRGYEGAVAYTASSAARSTVAALIKEYSLREVAAWPIDTLHVHCVVFQIPDNSDRDAVLARLTHDARVQIAQPLQVFATSSVTYNDPLVDLQSGFKTMDVASAHQWSRGDGVRVAVIDTGIDSKHPDLVGRIVEQENFVDGDAKQFLQDRHGTGVAGIIAATGNNSEGIVGVAPGVKIIAIKACWQLQATADDARCNSFTLAQALTAALDAKVQVVNLSISGPADPLLSELITQGVRRGLIYVGAAPRDGSANSFPVSNAGVIAVDAAGLHSGFHDALAAPGTDILTLTPSGHYDFSSGASLATAHVTGTVALLLHQDHKLNAQSVLALLQRSRDTNSDASINACTALAAVNVHASCKPTVRAAASAGSR
jgi:hypothetical protein